MGLRVGLRVGLSVGLKVGDKAGESFFRGRQQQRNVEDVSVSEKTPKKANNARRCKNNWCRTTSSSLVVFSFVPLDSVSG